MVTKYNRMPSLFLTRTSFNRNSNLANEDVQVKQLDVLEATDVFGIAFDRTNTLEECTTGRPGIGTTRRLPLATDARMCQDVSNKSNASPVCSFENWKRFPCYLNNNNSCAGPQAVNMRRNWFEVPCSTKSLFRR